MRDFNKHRDDIATDLRAILKAFIGQKVTDIAINDIRERVEGYLYGLDLMVKPGVTVTYDFPSAEITIDVDNSRSGGIRVSSADLLNAQVDEVPKKKTELPQRPTAPWRF